MLRSRNAVLLMVVAISWSCIGSNNSAQEGFSSTAGVASGDNDLTNLQLAEISPIQFASGKATLSLNSDSTYLLVVSSANEIPANYTVQLSNESLSSLNLLDQALEVEKQDPDESLFHQYMREMEVVISESDEFSPKRTSKLSTLATPPNVGDRQTFRVLSSMTSLAQYQEVQTELKVSSTNVFFYLDDTAAGKIGDEEIQELVSTFESMIRPRDQALFGTESDINGDGHLSIVMTCVPNTMSSSGIVTGFFYPGDLYANSKANPASNEEEVFYILCPDPDGKYGVPISSDFVQNVVPGVLGHEYQHMISFNEKVLKNKGTTQEPWLNEACSHMAEDLVGYGNENASRAKLFLAQPNTTALIPSTSPRLAERGASYLFLRYLYEQHPNGNQFLHNACTGPENGIKGLVDSFAGTDPDFDEFGELLNRWAVTLFLSGMTDNPQYNYQARGMDPETGNKTGICLRCDANDGRGTKLDGPTITEVTRFPIATNLYASASQFFLIRGAPASLAINSAGSPTLTGSILRLER